MHYIYDFAISAHSSVTELSILAVLYNRDSVKISALDHPVHQIPLSGDGVELTDIGVTRGGTVSTA